jgi:hypothetical protein
MDILPESIENEKGILKSAIRNMATGRSMALQFCIRALQNVLIGWIACRCAGGH